MKILEVIFSLGSGGAEQFVVDLSNELSSKHEVVLLTLKDDSVENRDFYKNKLNNSVRYDNLGLKDGFSLSSLFAVDKKIRLINPDVVHIHIAFRFCLLPIFFFGKPRYFLTIHNEIKGWYTNKLNRILFNSFGYLNRVSFVTISKSNYDDFNREYKRCSNTLIYNGRKKEEPTSFFDDVKKEIDSFKSSSSTMVFLHVARCAPQKNQQLLIHAFNRLVSKSRDAILLILGRGFDSDLGNDLKNIAGERIYFLGEKNNVQDYVLNSDALVLSSLYEGMPITVIEALQNEVPIISTPVCGVIDVVKCGETGCISADFTHDSFLLVWDSFVKEQKKYTIESNFSDVKRLFSISECAKSYETLFNLK